MLRLHKNTSMEALKKMDARGEIPRVRHGAPYKDTIPVGDRSVVIVRFRADNPGFWFFHCHIELHTELGMALVIQSGNVSEMPLPPYGFPKCKNWDTDDTPPQPLPLATGGEFDSQGNFSTIAETPVIVGIAVLICVSLVAVMLGILHCLRARSRDGDSRYQLIQSSTAHSQAGPYRSLRETNETALSGGLGQ
ncbi:laccase-4 [Elysia marginata]|uniref:Laccase-4 n=1 Tax=Elysia marginata TaxID=1093978 RepID=A0AAV4FGX8_9GAST|nr:laccase-4 [Elysia marginata]